MSRSRTAPIAYVCPDRQLHVIDETGQSRAQTAGGDPMLMWGSWEAKSQTTHSWPSWSPDGTRLACFAVRDEIDAYALVLEVDGLQSAAVCSLDGRLPIYLFWAPSGDRLALLTQQVEQGQDALQLAIAKADEPGSDRVIAEGSPLFFTWAEESLAAFVGDQETGATSISLFPRDRRKPKTFLPGEPGNFCAPVWAEDKLLYVLQSGPTATIVATKLDDPEPEVIEELRGLVALIRSPDGRRVARAVAADGDGTPYRDLAVFDVATGEVTHLIDEPCLAFFWLPNGEGIVTARVDTAKNLMKWHLVGMDGSSSPIVEMFPTRDFGFYLRFFEQYGQSHQIIDPESEHLLLVGGLAAEGDPHQDHALWEVPIHGGEPTRLADAVFAVYGPKRGSFGGSD